MFFNIENYFEAKNDSLHPKREFAPSGVQHWTRERFNKKSMEIFRTFVAVGGAELPDIIGLCEIENRTVLNRLYYDTPFAKYEYGIVHQESPDRRGIDVALFYKKSTFTLVDKKFIYVNLGKRRTTRDILYAKGIVNQLDTLHIMVVHAPSKYGGAAASEPNRQAFAKVLRSFIDSLNSVTKKLYLVVMGDFNDLPDSPSVEHIVQASRNLHSPHPDSLYNLAMPLYRQNKKAGTIKYNGKWQLIDMMLVSGLLLNSKEPIYCEPTDYRIFKMPYLMEEDERYADSIPKRTYKGMRYNGGISDHLPVVLDIRQNF
jgi:endonuclease/exonuclease/phosphatase family metal-dependent hydrolase